MAEGKTEKLIGYAALVVGNLMVLYHLITTQYVFQGAIEHQNIHLGFALILVFLGTMMATRRRGIRLAVLGLLLVGIFVTGYIKIRYEHLEWVTGFPDPIDCVVGILLVIIVIEAARQAFGPVLPVLALVFIAYFFFGHLIPEPFSHGYFAPEVVLSWLGIGLAGIFGLILGVSANMVFLFVVFGGLIQALGAHHFILNVGRAIGRRTAGGPGHTAVVSSAMVGMFTGAAIADVALVGSFTIPVMKKAKYSPVLAGGIASVAGIGAQMMPPVMGETAFLLAVFMGVPYVVVMVAGIIPAIIYYIAIFMGVEIIARKEQIPRWLEKVEVNILLRCAPMFIIPILVIIVLLAMRFTPMYAAFYAIMSILAVSLFQKETRPSLAVLTQGVAKGAMAGAKIAVVLGMVGMIAQTLITTGLGFKLGFTVEGLAGGNLAIALLLTMLFALILGCGVPTPAAYILVAIVVVPVLIRMGVMPMAAHFFAWYFAIISALTPPVALASMTGSAIAGSNFWRTSVQAFKIAIIAYLLPFMFVYNPAILAHFSDPLSTVVTLVAIIGALIALTIVFYGYFFTKVLLWERFLFALSGAALFATVTSLNYLFFGLGILLFIPAILHHWRRKHETGIPEKAGIY